MNQKGTLLLWYTARTFRCGLCLSDETLIITYWKIDFVAIQPTIVKYKDSTPIVFKNVCNNKYILAS